MIKGSNSAKMKIELPRTAWPVNCRTWRLQALEITSVIWVLHLSPEYKEGDREKAKKDLAVLLRIIRQLTEEFDLIRPLVALLDPSPLRANCRAEPGKRESKQGFRPVRDEEVRVWQTWAADSNWHHGDFMLFMPRLNKADSDCDLADEIERVKLSLSEPIGASSPGFAPKASTEGLFGRICG